MSIVRIEEDNIERYTLLANPRYTFSSSSSGVTGSLPLFADGSSTLKDVYSSPGLYVSLVPATAASANITIVSTTSIANDEIELISSDGTVVTYIFKTGTTGDLSSGKVIVSTDGSPTVTDYASRLVSAILSSNGHNGKITATSSGTIVTLVQREAGDTGNTVITLTNVTTEITKVDFSGGKKEFNSGDPNGDADVESLRAAVKAQITGTNGSGAVGQYLDLVNSLPSSRKFSKSQKVIRFDPTVNINPNFLRKKAIRQNLFPYYRHTYNTAQWAYTNYHTLNFVTGGNLPSNSVIIYPAGTGTYALENQNALAPSASFTFDFYINPRYTQEYIGQPIAPGTIFHMSSCYALSLVTGSSRGLDGKVDGFRLLLQLSQSAEISPSRCVISTNTVTAPTSNADKGFLFASSDNSLKLNNWHHVGVRWGGPNTNGGTGSFVIDGVDQGTFVITSQSCMQSFFEGTGTPSDPDALFLGNFFEGTNSGNASINGAIAGYFNSYSRTNEGVTAFGSSADDVFIEPVNAQFRHPLNAELHDIKIFKTYRNDQQLLTSSMMGYPLVTGSSPITGSQDIIFYVPPLFTKTTLSRNVLQTPFQNLENTVTDDPFNVAMSFGVGGHELNLENFVKDFVRDAHPKLLNLTASEITVTTNTAQTANYFLYESGSLRKRNITVLPCDNGRFKPNYSILLQSGTTEKYTNDFGITDLSSISLTDMVNKDDSLTFASMYAVDRNVTGSLTGNLIVPILENSTIEPGVGAGQYLTILQRTGDNSSNEVSFFDVSNMFYGDRIKPGSVTLTDLSVTGSAGRVSIKLKDDGYGNLYRADSLTPHAKWASVGNVLYEEGILVVKSPNIPMFGVNSWEISFEGERNIHVYEVNVPAPKGLVNSSTNPTFQPMLPSDYPSETASSFVYVTGIQLHDENLNVVGRANLAQPVIKRDGDRIVFRLRMDY